MGRTKVPSFVTDPEQAAELAAMIRDAADGYAQDVRGQGGEMTRRDRARHEQALARYRRWADELAPEDGRTGPPGEPLHIRPADFGQRGATG